MHDLVKLLTQTYSRQQMDVLEQDVTVFVSGRNKQLFEALLACVRNSLNLLKRRFASHSVGMLFIEAPVFRVEVELDIPNLILRPELNQIQKGVNFVATEVLQCTKRVFCWGQDRARAPASGLRSYFRDIASNKEVVKSVLQLTGSFTGLQRACNTFVGMFGEFAYLWKESRPETIEKFAAKEPGIEAYEAELERYEKIIAAIDALPPYRVIGSLSVETTAVREGLRREAMEWRQMFGARLNQNIKAQMKELSDFIDDTLNQLTKKTKDFTLEDINQMMKTLEELRVMEAQIHMKLAPIDDTYSILTKYSVRVKPEESEYLEQLRAKWDRLKKASADTMGTLLW